MKGTFRIGGALFLGTVIILVAFLVRGGKNTAESGSIVALPAPDRNAISTKDSDGDGTEDWEEALAGRVFEQISVPTSTELAFGENEPYEEPTTLTGKFSEAFLQDYLQGKMQGVDFSDTSALVGSAVSAIDASTKSRRYTRLDIVQIPTDTDSAYVYGNALAGIVLKYPTKNENEALILQRAIESDSPEMLKELEPARVAYENILADSLQLPIPENFSDEHVAFLNAAEAIRTDITAMQVAFTDPLYTLARMNQYEADVRALYEALQEILGKLRASGATYRNDEPGAFFYLFES